MSRQVTLALVVIVLAAFTASTTYAQDTTFTVTIVSDTLIQGDLCYKFQKSENGTFTGSHFEYIENDSLRMKGYQDPGNPFQFSEFVVSPLNPTVGDSWWGNWRDDPARVTVTNCLWVEVPAGIFLVYWYDYVDSLTQEYAGYLLVSLDNGWVSAMLNWEADTARIVLDSLDLAGGSGPIPLAIGNFWQYVEGVHDTVEQGGVSITNFTPHSFNFMTTYPNPFNPSSIVSYELRVPSFVNLDVFDLSGSWITTLEEGWKAVGVHEVLFDGKGLPSGVYMARLQAGELKMVNKMVLLK